MMDILIPLIQVVGGLAVLVIGGEMLVRGAVAAANALGVAPLVIGLTIVSFGTSAPEMVISVQAVLDGHPDIALGNIIGSNIANILLILGIAALISPIIVDSKLLKRDVPLLMAVSLLLYGFCYNGVLERYEAAIFLAILGYYTFHIYRASRTGGEDDLEAEMEEETHIVMPVWKTGVFILAGLGLLVAGSDVLVTGAVSLARIAGVSEAVIGLTILAVGSSAPELITSVVAALRKHGDIALGNVVGSNLFNITSIGGVAAMISPMEVAPRFIQQDMFVMLGVTLLLALFMWTGNKVVRAEGAALVAGFVAYTLWLVLGPQA